MQMNSNGRKYMNYLKEKEIIDYLKEKYHLIMPIRLIVMINLLNVDGISCISCPEKTWYMDKKVKVIGNTITYSDVLTDEELLHELAKAMFILCDMDENKASILAEYFLREQN